MPIDWSKINWAQVGGAFGALLVTAFGSGALGTRLGSAGFDEIKKETAGPRTQQQMLLEHVDWQVSCGVLIADGEGREIRRCQDGVHVFVSRYAQSKIIWFVAEPPAPPPVILGHDSWLALPGGVAYAEAPYTCLMDHGQPSGEPPHTWGQDLGGGWQVEYLHWRDGCRLRRSFHHATAAATEWQWDVCAEAHR